MKSIREMVVDRGMSKLAEFELNKDYSTWSQDILTNFSQTYDYFPAQYITDVVISNVDQNLGYAKGSVIVSSGIKKINFPVIIQGFKMSPIDTFVMVDNNGKPKYRLGTKENVMFALDSHSIGVASNGRYSRLMMNANGTLDIKFPGNVAPKIAVENYDVEKFASAWKESIKHDDMTRLHSELVKEAGAVDRFVENTGSQIKDVVSLPTEQYKMPVEDRQGQLDVSGVVAARNVITALESELFSGQNLLPLRAQCACEIRLNEFDSVDAFMSTSQSMAQRSLVTERGHPVAGVLLQYVRDNEDSSDYSEIFISANAQSFSKRMWLGTENGNPEYAFFGTDISDDQKIIDGIVGIISSGKQTFVSGKNGLRPSPLRFPEAVRHSEMEINGTRLGKAHEFETDSSPDVVVMYKSEGKWVCREVRTGYKSIGFRQAIVNSKPVLVSDEVSIIPAPVLRPQYVKSVASSEYQIAVGKTKKILLIPENAVVLNLAAMREINKKELVTPDKDIVSALNRRNDVDKIDIMVSTKHAGFYIDGIDDIRTVCGISKEAGFGVVEAKQALRICGVDNDTADRALGYAIKVANEGGRSRIYGNFSNVFKTDSVVSREKIANEERLISEICNELKVCLVKEASSIQDPHAVDAVLSLNFINPDNIRSYVESIPVFDNVESELCGMLVASRMGLRQIDEAAIKSAIESVNKVRSGLITLKTAAGR